jgi:hypothetical protein
MEAVKGVVPAAGVNLRQKGGRRLIITHGDLHELLDFSRLLTGTHKWAAAVGANSSLFPLTRNTQLFGFPV